MPCARGSSAAFSRWRKWCLCLLLSTLSIGVSAQLNPPIYIGTYVAEPHAQLIGIPGTSFPLTLRSLSIATTDGNAATITMVVDYGSVASGVGYYKLYGSFGCAAGRLELAFGDRETNCVQQPGSTIVGLCQNTLVQYCAGVMDYSVYEALSGTKYLEVSKFCQSISDILLECDDCVGAPSCSATINQVIIEGGTANINGSQPVIINGGTIYANNTPVLNVDASQDITINAPVLETVNVDSSTDVTLQQGDSVTDTNVGTPICMNHTAYGLICFT
jgi:hypothetical protein